MAVPALSLPEKLDLLPALLSVGGTIVYELVVASFRGADGAETFGREVSTAITRKATDRLSINQLQYLRGTSTGTFQKWSLTQPGLQTSSEKIKDGAKLHWIGDAKSSIVLYHMHGGGYILPLSIGHLQMMKQFMNSVKSATGKEVAVAALEYITAPQGPYPSQFRQANAGLHHLLDSGISPSNIVIVSDSAGAHIALCLASHLLHPHPLVDAPPTLSQPLGGIMLISPRVTNEVTAASFVENTSKDTLSKETIIRWITNFRSGSKLAEDNGCLKDGYWTEPRAAPLDWWDDFSKKVTPNVFMCTGQHECYRDDVSAFAGKLADVKGLELEFIVEKRGVHDSPLMDIGAGRPKTDLILSAESWLANIARN